MPECHMYKIMIKELYAVVTISALCSTSKG